MSIASTSGHLQLGVGTSSIGLAMIALTVTCASSMCVSPVFWSLATALLSGTAGAGSIALINSLGALGGFPGPWLVGAVKDWTGSPADALYFLSGFFFLCGILAVTVFRPHAVRAISSRPEVGPD